MRTSSAAGRAALEIEELLLAREPAAVAGQRAVGADHAMAGHDDRQAVIAVGAADRAHGFRLTDAAASSAYEHVVPGRNLLQRLPYAASGKATR